MAAIFTPSEFLTEWQEALALAPKRRLLCSAAPIAWAFLNGVNLRIELCAQVALWRGYGALGAAALVARLAGVPLRAGSPIEGDVVVFDCAAGQTLGIALANGFVGAIASDGLIYLKPHVVAAFAVGDLWRAWEAKPCLH